MSSIRPLEFHAPSWHGDARTPVVDGKYVDRTTGQVRDAPGGDGHQEYIGPPAVDIVVRSMHEDTLHCAYRAARSFPMEAILGHVMKVVGQRKLKLDSVMATTYTVRVILSHELTPQQFSEIAKEMANGIWDEVE